MFYKQKKSKLFILTAMLISLTLIFTAAPAGFFDVTAKVDESDVKNVEQQLANVESELNKLKNKIKSTESTLESEIQDKENIDNNLTKLGESIDIAVKLVGKYDEQIKAKEEEIAAKEKEIQEKYTEFETWIKMTYEDGDVNYIEMVLNTDNFEDFLSSTEYIANIIEYQNRLMKELDSDMAELQKEKDSLEEDKAKQVNIKASLVDKKEEMASLAEESANYISNLQANQALYEAQKKESEEQQKALNKELETLLAKIAQQNAVYIGGVYQWPAETQFTRISSDYGYRGSEFHLGIDIPADYGSKVYAANGGKVIKATYHYSYGNYVLIDHGGGQATLYAHNSKLLVSEGDTVSKGDVIALVGSTGASTGNHIHFEVRINGVTTDPKKYVS